MSKDKQEPPLWVPLLCVGIGVLLCFALANGLWPLMVIVGLVMAVVAAASGDWEMGESDG